jgi:hypothetical protein
MKQLLEEAAELEPEDKDGQTPLSRAATYGRKGGGEVATREGR